jgi:coenzyme F420-reducing hydrogenase gamma subunit
MGTAPKPKRPKLAVAKFASCDGCQLTLFDACDDLAELWQRFEVAMFLEASRWVVSGGYDLALVEGSITTTADAARIRQLRRRTRVLVTIGACATAGGIQSLRNFASTGDWLQSVYPRSEQVATLGRASPIRDHVEIDFELHGCPIASHQLAELLGAFLAGRRPEIPDHAQCIECKQHGTACIMVGGGVPCLGPVTRAGCGNLCPPLGRGCYGCFGPMPGANVESLARQFAAMGMRPTAIRDLFRSFNAAAPEFQRISETHDRS